MSFASLSTTQRKLERGRHETMVASERLFESYEYGVDLMIHCLLHIMMMTTFYETTVFRSDCVLSKGGNLHANRCTELLLLV